jgi:hypothetical protein
MSEPFQSNLLHFNRTFIIIVVFSNLDQINILTHESSSTLNSLHQIREQEQPSASTLIRESFDNKEEGIKRWLDKGASKKLNKHMDSFLIGR